MGKYLQPSAAVTLDGNPNPNATFNLASFKRQDLINHLNSMSEDNVGIYFYQNDGEASARLAISGLNNGLQADNRILGDTLPCPNYCPKR